MATRPKKKKTARRPKKKAATPARVKRAPAKKTLKKKKTKAAPKKAASGKHAPTKAAKPAPVAPKQPKAPAKPRYYITTSIAYPNGPPHIGYGYEVICTDAIARFKRLDGYDVFFLTGTDEHGIKLLQTAHKENLTPGQLIERTTPRFRAMVARMNCSNDDFIRTTEERHHRSSEAIWR